MQEAKRRHSHWTRLNHDTSTPTSFVFVDCQPHIYKGSEDDRQETHTLGVVCGLAARLESGRKTRWEDFVGHDPCQFWTWLCSRLHHRRPLWLVAYNCSYILTLLRFWESLTDRTFTFDRTPFTDSLGKLRWTNPGFLVSHDPPTAISVHSRLGSLHAIDIRNFWRLQLGELAELTGETLGERPGETGELQEWIDYTVSRARVVKAAMMELCDWWRANDLGNFGFTASSLAWHAYRHRWMPVQYRQAGTVGTLLVHEDAEALAVEREAMAGGECRVFYTRPVVPVMAPHGGRLWKQHADPDGRGEGPVYCLDVSSLYPAVMHDNVFPVELVCHQPKGSLDDIHVWRKYLALIARVQIESHDDTYPYRESACGKHRTPRQGVATDETYWAQGRFWTTLAGPELLRAVDSGIVLQVGSIVAYKWGHAFRSWVKHWWAERCRYLDAGQVGKAALVKLLLVSLPGKLGQRNSPWVDDPDFAAPVPWGYYSYTRDGKTDKRVRRFFGWLSQIEATPGEAPHSIPAVAAYIYSFARDRMRTLRLIAGNENLYYQDTDSLHTTEDGYKRLQRAGEVAERTLGKLRLQRVVDRACYRGPKDYTHDGKHTIAGLKEDAVEVRPNVFRQIVGEGLDGLVGRYGSMGESGPDGTARLRAEDFTIGRTHARAIVTKTGSVRPPIVWDGQLILTDSIEPWRTKHYHPASRQA